MVYNYAGTAAPLIAGLLRRVVKYLPASRWSGAVGFAIAVPLLGGCGLSEFAKTQHTENSLQQFRAATQEAAECRAEIAQKPQYQILGQHMPLTDIDDASLSQMAAPEFATKGEISALNAWIDDLKPCRDRLVQAIVITIPSFRPIFETWWDNDDIVFVRLAHHKIAWGEAVLALRGNATKLQAEAISHADLVLAELEKQEQAQIARRTAILSSIIGKLP
jgi:hypothetical protein